MGRPRDGGLELLLMDGGWGQRWRRLRVVFGRRAGFCMGRPRDGGLEHLLMDGGLEHLLRDGGWERRLRAGWRGSWPG